MEKDGRSSAMSEGEGLDEEDDDGDDDEEGGAETEEQSGNESEMNEQEEDVSLETHGAHNAAVVLVKGTRCHGNRCSRSASETEAHCAN